MRTLSLSLSCALGLAACGGPPSSPLDAGGADAARPDGAPLDAAPLDADRPDAALDGGGLPTEQFDVVVQGAGVGGIAAAIQARRLGASVLLLETTDWVGGQMAAASVTTMDGGDGGPTSTGLWGEWRARVQAYYADTTRFPPAGRSIHTGLWSTGSTCFEPHVARGLLEDWLEEEGVVVRYRTRVAQVARDGNRVTGVRTSDDRAVAVRVLIDATEHGDVIPLAGARYRAGNSTSDALSPDACIQSMTYVATIRRYPAGLPAAVRFTAPPPGYDTALRNDFAAMVTTEGLADRWAHPWSSAHHNAYRGMPDSAGSDYDASTPERITRTSVNMANDHPRWHFTWTLSEGACQPAPNDACCAADVCQTPGPTQRACCTPNAEWIDRLTVRYLEDPAERRRIDCEAKLLTLQFLYFFQTEVGTDWSVADDEGFDTPYNTEDNACPNIPEALRPIERLMPVMPYVRESRRIVALHTLTAREIQRTMAEPYARVSFPTSIAVGDYPTDLHNCNSDETFESDLGETAADGSHVGGWFQVPFESMIPVEIDGLLAAEKNIGVSRLAGGGIRLQPITALTGAAAGTIAGLAVRDGVAPRAVDPLDVQLALVDRGAAIGTYHFVDVQPGHEYYGDVQIANVRGFMAGQSPSSFGVDGTATRAQAAVVLTSLFGLMTRDPEGTFTDVPADHWAARFIEALERAGIVSGCGGGNFCPDDPVTRIQLAIMLTSGLSLPDGSLTFPDVDASLQRFASAAVTARVMDRCSATDFCPNQSATRGELARAVRRTLQYRLN